MKRLIEGEGKGARVSCLVPVMTAHRDMLCYEDG